MINITFLGTSAMIPTKERNHSSIFLEAKDKGILIDCGEGTQRQLRIAKIKPRKITTLLITHWHGDHVLGIPGLLQNLSANNYDKTLEIYGPKNSKKFLKNMLSGIVWKERIKYKVEEIGKGKFYKDKDLEISSIPTNHTIDCLAYSIKENDKIKININYTKKFGLEQHPLLGKLQQGKNITYNKKKILAKKATKKIPGKKITIIMDTAPMKSLETFAKNSDLLIAEATWGDEMESFIEKRKHLTSKKTAEIAKKAKVKQLILTHFSQRYKSTKQLGKEAKKVFKNTEAAIDFMKVKI